MSTLTAEEEIAAVFDFTLPPCPYPGLRSFEKEEWAIYFGREKATDKVVSKLLETQFVALHGDSGCGKSSLVRAGVLPRLEREYARGGTMWRTAVMLPRAAPLWNLATTLAELEGGPASPERVEDFRRVLNLGAEGAAQLAEMVRRNENDFVCVLVDQFEEIFQFADSTDKDEAQHFIDVLTGVQRAKPPGLHFILTMRSEFLGECAGFTGLADTINETQYLLPRMELSDLIRALREPAQLYGGSFRQELAQQMIADAGMTQDQLPLMQHAAMLLYRREVVSPETSQPWVLDLDDYKDSGGPARLLSTHADEVFFSIAGMTTDKDAETKRGAIVRRIFQALTEDSDGHMVRRPQTLRQLSSLAELSIDELLELLAPLRAESVCFIRVFASGPVTEDQIVDISHEALMRNWDRLQDWIHAESENAGIYRRLVQDTTDYRRDPTQLLSPALARRRRQWWDDLGPTQVWANRYTDPAAMVVLDDVKELLGASLDPRNRGFDLWREELAMALDTFDQGRRGLLTGPELDVARRYRTEQKANLKPAEAAFIDNSIEAADAAKAAAERTRKFVLWGSIGAAGVSLTLAVVAAVFAMVAGDERQNAQQQASRALVAQSKALLSDDRPTEAMAYALAAIPEGKWRTPSPATRAAYVAMLQASDQRRELRRIVPPEDDQPAISSVVWTDDGKQIVSSHTDGSVRFWNAAEAEGPARFWRAKTHSPARFWRKNTGALTGKPVVLSAGSSPVLSPDGKLALIIERPVNTGATTAANAKAPEASGVSRPTGSTVQVLRTSDGARTASLQHDDIVNFATFSPDGKTILSTSNDLTFRVWDAATGKQLVKVSTGSKPADALMRAAISPSGRLVAGDPRSGNYRVFEVPQDKTPKGRLLGEFLPTSNGSWKSDAIVFTPNSDHVITSYNVAGKSHVQIWTISSLSEQQNKSKTSEVPIVKTAEYTIDVFESRVTDLESVGGHDFIASSTDGVARLWRSGGSSIVLRGHQGAVTAISRSPDRKLIASGGADGAIRIWQINPAVVPPAIATIKDEDVFNFSLNEAGDRAVAISDRRIGDSKERTLRLFDTQSGDVLQSVRLSKPYDEARFEYGVLVLTNATSAAAQLAMLDPETLKTRREVEIKNTSSDEQWIILPTFERRLSREKDGSLILHSGTTADKEVRLVSSNRQDKSGKPDEVAGAAGTGDGKKLLLFWRTAGGVIWDFETGQKLTEAPVNQAGVVSVAANKVMDRILVLGSDGALVLWSGDFKAKLATLSADAKGGSMSFSAFGGLIQTRTKGGEPVMLWRAEDGRYQATLRDSGDLSAVNFSSDEVYAYAFTNQSSVKVWDTTTGELLDEIRGPSGTIRMLPGELKLVSISDGDEIRQWPLRFGNNVENEMVAKARDVVKTLSPLTLSQRCEMSIMVTEKECSVLKR